MDTPVATATSMLVASTKQKSIVKVATPRQIMDSKLVLDCAFIPGTIANSHVREVLKTVRGIEKSLAINVEDDYDISKIITLPFIRNAKLLAAQVYLQRQKDCLDDILDCQDIACQLADAVHQAPIGIFEMWEWDEAHQTSSWMGSIGRLKDRR